MHYEGDLVYDFGDRVIITGGCYEGKEATIMHEAIMRDNYWLKLDDGKEIVLDLSEFEPVEE